MEIQLTPETEAHWWLWKAQARDHYFDTVAAPKVQEARAPGSRQYTTQFGQVLHVPPGLNEVQAHKAAKHMAVGHLTLPQRALYEAGKLQVYVVDELGRRHMLMHAQTGRLGVAT